MSTDQMHVHDESGEGKDSPNPPFGVKRADSPAPVVDFRHATGIKRQDGHAVQPTLSTSMLSGSSDGIQQNAVICSASDDSCVGHPDSPRSKTPASLQTTDDESSVRRVQSNDSLVDMSPPSSGSCSPTRHHDEQLLPHQHHNVCATTFEKLKLIGKGDVGKVYLVQHRFTNDLYAMKTLDKQTMMRRKKIRRALTERDILEYVDHPFIVTLHWSFQSVEKLYLVMDYCAGGSLFRLMQHQPGHCFHEETVRFYAAEILLALEYLHLNGFIYRDLKMENVLVHESGHIMITDFDLSIKADSRSDPQVLDSSGEIFAVPATSSNAFVGTAEYLAPEVICGTSNQSCSVDWWTYGILIYEGIYGHTPFQGKTTEQICAHILDGGLRFPDHHLYPVSNDCKTLIKKLLDADPRKRLGGQHDAADIKKHKFFDKINFTLIRNMPPPIVPKLKNPTDTSHHRSGASKDELTESDTDSELSEDEQMIGPFKDFKQVFQEGRTKRTSLNDPLTFFGRSVRNLRASSSSISSTSSASSACSNGPPLSTSTGSIEHPQPIPCWQQFSSSDPNLRRTASCSSMETAEYWAKLGSGKNVHNHKENHHHHHHHHHHDDHHHHGHDHKDKDHHHQNVFRNLFSSHKK